MQSGDTTVQHNMNQLEALLSWIYQGTVGDIGDTLGALLGAGEHYAIDSVIRVVKAHFHCQGMPASYLPNPLLRCWCTDTWTDDLVQIETESMIGALAPAFNNATFRSGHSQTFTTIIK